MIDQLLPGDVILTRNEHETDNSSPGYWNHASLHVGDNIIEAQAEPNCVIESSIAEFFNRYPQIVVLRFLAPRTISYPATRIARELIGAPYRKTASMFKFLRPREHGENCVSVIRKSYAKVLGYDPGWKTPDDIIEDRKLFYVVGHKE